MFSEPPIHQLKEFHGKHKCNEKRGYTHIRTRTHICVRDSAGHPRAPACSRRACAARTPSSGRHAKTPR